MKTIKDREGRTLNLSDEIYEITENASVRPSSYQAGNRVRLISGVDGSSRPGHHFNRAYATVCRVEAKEAELIGVGWDSLRKVA